MPAAVDSFADRIYGLDSPVAHTLAVTPTDDLTDLGFVSRGIIVGVSGDVAVITLGGETVTLPALAAGIIHPFRVSRIKLTGTTATGIKVVW